MLQPQVLELDRPLSPPIRALFLDFDSTISRPQFIQRLNQWAVADKIQVFKAMSEAEIVANFGGAERIGALADMLAAMTGASVELYIISIGMKAAFLPHLEAVGLSRFFADANVFGQDCSELRSVGFVKARLIRQLMDARGYKPADALFVDDSFDHISATEESGTCRTLHVAGGGGMQPRDLDAIRLAAGLQPGGGGK